MSEAPTSMANESPLFRLLLRPEPGVADAERALRRLKITLRRLRLQCISIERVRP